MGPTGKTGAFGLLAWALGLVLALAVGCDFGRSASLGGNIGGRVAASGGPATGGGTDAGGISSVGGGTGGTSDGGVSTGGQHMGGTSSGGSPAGGTGTGGLAVASRCNGTLMLGGPPLATTGSRPVAVGDFNLDGKPDLAVWTGQSIAVSVLLGNGDGTFAAEVDYPTGSTPQSCGGGGLQRGRQARPGSRRDFWTERALGQWRWHLRPQGGLRDRLGPHSVAVGDFNVDGKPDLASRRASGHGERALGQRRWHLRPQGGLRDRLISVFGGGGGLQRGRQARPGGRELRSTIR